MTKKPQTSKEAAEKVVKNIRSIDHVIDETDHWRVVSQCSHPRTNLMPGFANVGFWDAAPQRREPV
jgi:hypothetical protein